MRLIDRILRPIECCFVKEEKLQEVRIIENNRGGWSITWGSVKFGNYPTYADAYRTASSWNGFKLKRER